MPEPKGMYLLLTATATLFILQRVLALAMHAGLPEYSFVARLVLAAFGQPSLTVILVLSRTRARRSSRR